MLPEISMIAEDAIDALNAWLTKAGLRGEPETALVNGFCERAVAAGLPISRAQVFIDTLHPVHEGRLVRWGHDPSQPAVVRDGHVERIRGTYHPVVAAPKSPMLYLWALAGESTTLTPDPDPRYA